MSAARHELAPERFPMLSQFAAGYLHQDFVVEHKTPAGALRAFLADASDEERVALRDELKRFRDAAHEASWPDVRAAFEALGGAWSPKSRAALNQLFALPIGNLDDDPGHTR